MDDGYSYMASDGSRASIYVPPEFAPPVTLALDQGGVEVLFERVDELTLNCAPVTGVQGRCDSFECHRRALGDCQCGRHVSVRLQRAGA